MRLLVALGGRAVPLDPPVGVSLTALVRHTSKSRDGKVWQADSWHQCTELWLTGECTPAMLTTDVLTPPQQTRAAIRRSQGTAECHWPT